MRRFVLLVPILLLPGCTGFGTFLTHAFSVPGDNPNRPAVDSENVRRAFGRPNDVEPLKPETGNVWPGPQGPDPTLTDIERQQNSGPARGFAPTDVPGAAPGLPAGRQPRPTGSSTPPGSVEPRPSGPDSIPPLPAPLREPPLSSPRPGGVVNTPRGTGVDAGGTGSYRQLTTPGGAGAIVVPNGNGTSTVISPDGGVQVIPTPR